jgi:hypothetical protein
MSNDDEGDTRQEQPVFTRHLWPWFVAGFAIVFFALSATVTVYALHPSGNAVVECKLGCYYMIEITRALHVSGLALGPASGNFSATIVTAVEHVLCSVAGGVAMLGVGWGMRQIRGRRRPPA